MIRHFHLKRDYFFVIFFMCLVLSIIALCVSIYLLKNASEHQIQSAETRYASYRVASELRRTSDDLTKMVRLYIVTRNEKYHNFFNEILSIRAGKSLRPEKYDEIYWDLITDEKIRPRPYDAAISLVQIVLNQGFTAAEFALLQESEKRSNELAKLEEKAIGMIQSNEDRNHAMELVFGKQYMETKAAIMAPIQKFFDLVNERTLERVSSLNKEVTLLISVTFFLAIFAAIAMIFCIFKTVSSLKKLKYKNKLLLRNILPSSIAARIERGEGYFIDEYPRAAIYVAELAVSSPMGSPDANELTNEQLKIIFDEFDKIARSLEIEVVKKDGDIYIAIARDLPGIPGHVTHMADFALAARSTINHFSTTFNLPIQIRAGIVYGSIITSVIGRESFAYDVWGDGFTKAKLLKSTCAPGEICLSEEVGLLVENQFVLELAPAVEDAPDTKIKTYHLQGRK